jgi:hypothetical protein
LAQSGHHNGVQRCLLLGVKRTLVGDAAMSAFDPKQNYDGPKSSHNAVTGKKKEKKRPHKAAKVF